MKFTTMRYLAAAIIAIGSISNQLAIAKGEKDNEAGSAPTLISLNDFPDWYRESLVREKEVTKKTKLKIKQFNVNQKVLGKIKLVDEAEGTMYYHIDIGSDTPIECYVISEFDGTANSLYSIIEVSLGEIEQLNKNSLSGKYTFAIDSGVLGATPYLLLDTLYVLGQGNNKISGILKGLSAETENSLQICLHNELGYRKTFLKVFASFLNAFQSTEGNPEFFEAIYQMTINGISAGYSHEKQTIDKDGDINIQTNTAMIMPVDASSVARSDSVSISWSRKDGSLINGKSYSIENGVLSSNLSIQIKNEKWQVEGEFQGKTFQTVLEHSDWLLSNYGNYVELIDLRKSKQDSVERYMWVPEADPSSALKVVLSKLPENPKANFKLDMGPLVMKFFADDKGIFRHGSLEQGPMIVDMKLLYVNGVPTLP